MRKVIPIKLRLEAKLNKDTNGCWLWTGFCNQDGYGTIQRGKRPSYPLFVHRVSWEIYKGPIPDGLNVLHNCPGGDNPRCCNPSHLFLGTQLDNVRDMYNKGRDNKSKGENQHSSKLTEKQVLEIRSKYIPYKYHTYILAKEYDVDPKTIHKIIKRITWKHLP